MIPIQSFPRKWSWLEVELKKLDRINRMISNFRKSKIKSAKQVCHTVKGNQERWSYKKVYKVYLEDNTIIRMDYFTSVPNHDMFYHQEIMYKMGINVPKIFAIFHPTKRSSRTYKFSEWIRGCMLEHVWNREEPFIKLGELIARINLIEKGDRNLTNREFSNSNIIWTRYDEVYLIDLEKTEYKSNVEEWVARTMMKRIQCPDRRELFLEGYKKIRDDTTLRNELYKLRGWTWE